MINSQKFKYLLNMTGGVLLVVLIGLGFKFNHQTWVVSDESQPSVSKDQLLDFQIIESGSNNLSTELVKYRYLSNQEVPPLSYRGLTEVYNKRTNNSVTFLESIKKIDDTKQQENYVSRFYSAPTFQKKGNKWYQIETATASKTAFVEQIKPTAFDYLKNFLGQTVWADTFYSHIGDGFVYQASSNWATVHSATTGSDVSTSTTAISVGVEYADFFGSKYFIYRGFLPFDTSTIPSNASITAASLTLYPTTVYNGDNDGDDYLNVVQTTQADYANLVTGDFDLCGAVSNPTVGATAIDISTITAGSIFTFDFNSTGFSWIARNGDSSSCGSTSGVTCLGVREGHDIINSATTATLDVRDRVIFYSSEQSGTAQDPYLTVSYSVLAPSKIIIDDGTIKIDGGTLKID